MKKLMLMLFTTVLFVSCSNDQSEDKIVSNNQTSKKLYAVGSKYGLNNNNSFTTLATLWIDGEPTILSKNGSSTATGIAIVQNNIFVVGNESLMGENQKIKVWKNNIAQDITNGLHIAEAKDIFVNQNDVYIVGNEHIGQLNKSVATLWKNGVAVRLTNNETISYANSVYVYGNDVYVAGEKIDNQGYSQGVIWKNGVETILENTHSEFNTFIKDIVVENNIVYACGYSLNGIKSIAKIWKNGTPINLSNENDFIIANAIAIHNSEVYVAGSEFDVTIYDNKESRVWKNGNIIENSKVEHSGFNSIQVTNEGIFTSGTKSGINLNYAIWKSSKNNNSFIQEYSHNNDEINTIAVD